MKKLLQLLKKWRKPDKPIPEEQLKEVMFVRIAKLKRLLDNPDFKEYINIIQDYIDNCQIRKLQYNFAHAYMIGDEKTFKMAAFLSNDIDMAQRLIDMAPVFVAGFEQEEKQRKESEQQEAEI